MADLSWHRRGAPERRGGAPLRPALARRAAERAGDLQVVLRLLGEHFDSFVDALIQHDGGRASDRVFGPTIGTLVGLAPECASAAAVLAQYRAGTVPADVARGELAAALDSLADFTGDLRRVADELVAGAKHESERKS